MRVSDAGDLASRVGELRPDVLRYCSYLLGNFDDAQDAAQEALEAALAARDGFRGEASLRTWVFGIARRRCIDHLRKRSRRRTDPSDEMDHHPDLRCRPDDSLAGREGVQRLVAHLAVLAEMDQSILLMRFDHGLSFQEIGEVLGIRPETAKVRAHRALFKLRPLLEKEGLGR